MLGAVANDRPPIFFLLEDSIGNEPIESGNDRSSADVELRCQSSAGQDRPAGKISLNNPEEDLAVNVVDRRGFSERGRTVVRQRFSAVGMVTEIERLYGQLVANNGLAA